MKLWPIPSCLCYLCVCRQLKPGHRDTVSCHLPSHICSHRLHFSISFPGACQIHLQLKVFVGNRGSQRDGTRWHTWFGSTSVPPPPCTSCGPQWTARSCSWTQGSEVSPKHHQCGSEPSLFEGSREWLRGLELWPYMKEAYVLTCWVWLPDKTIQISQKNLPSP